MHKLLHKRRFLCINIIFCTIKYLDKLKRLLYNKDMNKIKTVQAIGEIRSDFKEKFGIPRQSGRALSLRSEIIFYAPYNCVEAFRDLDSFSHIWLIFEFSKAEDKDFSPTVRPPRLGGNTRVGVFASRSPYRPNRIGLSCVKLEQIKHTQSDGIVLVVSGADLLDGTPILDIKPYIPFTDCKENALGGYASTHENDYLEVDFPQELIEKIPESKRAGLLDCLADDPRPSYQNSPKRIYGMKFAEFEIKFQVMENILRVVSVEKVPNA